ncbi:hypothetical protein Glove_658g24 [Diversispora epigaea]|uniref:Methyltransferase domain-containing protein n=1 Tax=Diversispora epigaea TaxID=1348612 RepID=A0A397G8M7_9GLOM|nr:hypothetical protein Glove_658g24 [Diversispora epigaea]
MGGRQSKTAVSVTPSIPVTLSSPTKTDGKAERRKKFRSWRVQSNNDGGAVASLNEAWNFTGGSKRNYLKNSSKILLSDSTAMHEEIERLQRQEKLFKRIWQDNFSSPVEDKLKLGGARVLDVGCGPGTWILEMAEAYPKSTFTGVDFLPIFPQNNNQLYHHQQGIKKLENAKFLQVNILDGLPFLDDTFDFVNMRLLITAFTITEWEQKVIPELIRVTRGGGWIEFMESDIQYHNQGPTTAKLTNAVKTFMKSKGIISPIDIYTTQSMEANDKFVMGIQTKEMSCFVGHWARELGQFAVDDINKGWNSIRTPMSTLMKVKSHEYDEIVATFAKEVEQYKTYFKTWRFYGQKVKAARSTSSTISWPEQQEPQESQHKQ